MLKRLTTIKQKTIAISMVSTSIAILLMSAVFAYEFSSEIKTGLTNRVAIQAEALAQNMTAALTFNDKTSAGEILSAFEVDTAVISALVTTSDDNIFAEYKAREFEHSGESIQLKHIKTIRRPITLNREHLGKIIVQVSFEQINQRLIRIFWYGLFIFLVAIIIAFIISSRLQKTISQPILNLRNLANKIAQHSNYKTRIHTDSVDEVGDLGQAFNHMLEQIEHRDSHLEKQVRQRTAELEKLAEEFRHRAFHDTLTGLPNRAMLNERFGSAVAHAKRTRTHLGILLLDLDNFKAINDTLGHDFGDELLKLLSSRIQAVIREEDIVSRIGGDEFIIMVQDLNNSNDLEIIATNVLKKLRDNITLMDQRIKSSVSIGGAIYPIDGQDLLSLKRHADIAMYCAKDSGKNQFRMFEPKMTDTANQRLIVQNDLQAAIEQHELEIHYQPKVNILTLEVVGCEALVRWNHPHEGFLSPAEFIPFAEENGLIRQLDHYVIQTVCQEIASWKKQKLNVLPVAVNLSGLHFQNEAILGVLKTSLLDANIESHMLEVELTEAILINDPDRALKILEKIRGMGIKVSLDDFGTGYSSLNYLRALPIDIVKLDKSFIDRITSNKQDKALTQGIITLAGNLDLGVVAEGVETKEQLKLLSQMGCKIVQGYYFKPPCPSKEFQQWLMDFQKT